MATETITLRLVAQDLMSGNVSKAIAGLDKLAKRGGLVGSVIQGVGQSFGQMLNPVGLVANGIGMVTDLMGDSMRAASDQAEALSKVTVVFGEQADEIKAWSNAAAGSMGLTKTAALEAAGSLGNLFDGLGIAEDAGRDMSKAIVQLAADLGSFNNVDTSEALAALQSGLVGETEPMRRFGSALSASRVEAYGMARGLERVNGKLTEAAKVQARYELILKDTKNAQGDFARTADGMANSQKTINASFEDMKVKVGEALKDAVTPFMAFMVDVVNQAPNTSNAVGRMTQQMRDMIEAQKDQVDTSQQQVGLFDWIGREIYGFISPQDKLISEYTNNNKEMVATLGVSRKEFALFVEAGLTMGLSLEDITKKARELQGQVGATAPLITGAWTGAMGDVEDMTVKGTSSLVGLEGTVSRLPEAFRIAVVDMKSTIETGKTGIVEQFRLLAWQSKHPFQEKSYSKWLGEQADKATRRMRKAARDGKPGVVAQYRDLRDQIMIEMLTLPQNLSRLQQQINNILGGIYGAVAGAVGNVFNLGGGSTGGVEARASGGPVRAGRPYIVGDGGEPELFVPSTNGTILNGRQMAGLGGPTIHVSVTHIGSMSEAEGDRLAAAIEKPLRRRMARAGA